MASLGSYLPEQGSAVWRRDRLPEYATESQTVRHIVIRGTEVKHEPSPHVLYRIDVLTEHSHWYICRRYSEFNDLHRKLVRKHKIARDLLPPKKLSGNFDPQLINARRQQLEQYLQKLINSDPQVSQSKELLEFLDLPAHDVVHVTELLARQLYQIGDKLLEQATPIALTINDLYCITKRLKLPMDLQLSAERATDLGHLYSFIHQLCSLKVIPPPPPLSVTRMAFEVTLFRSLTILKIDSVPLSQVSGLARVQQQLTKVTAQRCLTSLRELLIDSVEDRRPQCAETTESQAQLLDSWRLVATAKFTSNRVVVQPWLSLTYLNISYNKLTHLDDSLQVLSAIKELNISHNLLSCLELQYICLPTLTTLDLSYNNISTIESRQLVLENIKVLNMCHNLLSDLSPLISFISVESLNISENSISLCEHFSHLSQLKKLATLTVKGNPIMTNNAARLVLLARFMHKSRMVSIDGMEATVREQAKIRSLTEKFGTNTDHWPLSKRVVPAIPSPLMPLPPAPPTSPPTVHVSWSVESLPRPSNVSDTSPCHSLSTTISSCNDSMDHPLFFDATLSFKNSSIPPPSSRDDPDGRSDISTHSPPDISPSPLVLPTPPCTPLSAAEEDDCSTDGRMVSQPVVTPQMISGALEALTQAATSSPSDEGKIPELLSQALHNFISEHSCAAPPSTPFEDSDCHHPVSSADLIAALTATVNAHIDSSGGSGSGSNVPSVPVGSPQEGLSELVRLGIQPEAVLQALTSLSFQRKLDSGSESEEEEEEEELLRTITQDGFASISQTEKSEPRQILSEPTQQRH